MMSKRTRILLGSIAIAVVLGLGFWVFAASEDKGAGASAARETVDGKFRVAIAPEEGEISVGPIHTWLVTVTDREGQPVREADITLGGGMPAHAHGLPTEPRMVGEKAPGIYRVDGVKFSMIGKWVLNVRVEAGDVSDEIIFDVVVN